MYIYMHTRNISSLLISYAFHMPPLYLLLSSSPQLPLTCATHRSSYTHATHALPTHRHIFGRPIMLESQQNDVDMFDSYTSHADLQCKYLSIGWSNEACCSTSPHSWGTWGCSFEITQSSSTGWGCGCCVYEKYKVKEFVNESCWVVEPHWILRLQIPQNPSDSNQFSTRLPQSPPNEWPDSLFHRMLLPKLCRW